MAIPADHAQQIAMAQAMTHRVIIGGHDDFGLLPEVQQREIIAAANYTCTRLQEAKDNIELQWETLLRIKPELDTAAFDDDDKKKKEIEGFLDRTAWDICKMLRYSRPTRLGEAVDILKEILHRNTALAADAIDVTPTLYLGVALSITPGQEEEAEQAFSRGFSAPNIQSVWATSHGQKHTGAECTDAWVETRTLWFLKTNCERGGRRTIVNSDRTTSKHLCWIPITRGRITFWTRERAGNLCLLVTIATTCGSISLLSKDVAGVKRHCSALLDAKEPIGLDTRRPVRLGRQL